MCVSSHQSQAPVLEEDLEDLPEPDEASEEAVLPEEIEELEKPEEKEAEDKDAAGVSDLFQWGPTVRRYKLLTAEEEYRLAVASRTDQRAFDRLVLANLRLVLRMARRVRSQGVPYEDLVGEGIFGLIRAVEKFDPERGFRFSTYALYWIRQSIDRAVMNACRTVRIPVYVQKNLRYYEDILRRPDATPEDRETARKTLRLVHWFPVDAMSTSLQSSPHADSEVTYQDGLTDTGDAPDVALHKRQVAHHVQSLLTILTPRERKIITHRFFSDRKKTLSALADEMGISRERVRQIETLAIRKLRSSPQRALLRSLFEGGVDTV